MKQIYNTKKYKTWQNTAKNIFSGFQEGEESIIHSFDYLPVGLQYKQWSDE